MMVGINKAKQRATNNEIISNDRPTLLKRIDTNLTGSYWDTPLLREGRKQITDEITKTNEFFFGDAQKNEWISSQVKKAKN